MIRAMPERWHYETEHGRWNANALRLFPATVEPWQNPHRRGWVIMDGKRAMATVRCISRPSIDPRPWHARLEGYEFRTIEGIGAARLGIKWSPIRGFKTAKEAMKFLDAAIAGRPALDGSLEGIPDHPSTRPARSGSVTPTAGTPSIATP